MAVMGDVLQLVRAHRGYDHDLQEGDQVTGQLSRREELRPQQNMSQKTKKT